MFKAAARQIPVVLGMKSTLMFQAVQLPNASNVVFSTMHELFLSNRDDTILRSGMR